MSDEPTDPTVRALRLANVAERHIVDALVKQKQVLLERLYMLEQIRPHRYRFADGSISVWHCLDNLIPITDFSPPTPDGEQPNNR